jgi:hypothetical protein
MPDFSDIEIIDQEKFPDIIDEEQLTKLADELLEKSRKNAEEMINLQT